MKPLTVVVACMLVFLSTMLGGAFSADLINTDKHVLGTCTVWGDPHLITWDGTSYMYMGYDWPAWYSLVVSPDLYVTGRFWECQIQQSCIDEFKLWSREKDGSITFLHASINTRGEGKLVLGVAAALFYAFVKDVNGNSLGLDPGTGTAGKTVQISPSIYGSFSSVAGIYLLQLTIVGDRGNKTILFSAETLAISASNDMFQKTCGLCGTFTDNVFDDYYSGISLKGLPRMDANTKKFGDSWKITSNNPRWSCTTNATPAPTTPPTKGPTPPTTPPTTKPTTPPTTPPTLPPTTPPTAPPTNPPTTPPTLPPTTPSTSAATPTPVQSTSHATTGATVLPTTPAPTATPVPTTPPTPAPTATPAPTTPPTTEPTTPPTTPPTEASTTGGSTGTATTTGETSTTSATPTPTPTPDDSEEYIDVIFANSTDFTPPPENRTVVIDAVESNDYNDFVNKWNNTEAYDNADTACSNVGFVPGSNAYKTCIYDAVNSNSSSASAVSTITGAFVNCLLKASSEACQNGTALACTDACNAHGVCVSGKCECNKGYEGDACESKAALLTDAEKAGVITAGAVAGVAIGGAAFLALSGFGAKKGYDYLSHKNNQMSDLHSNPLYAEKQAGGTNPFYQNSV